jgi:hypothetical protein
VQDLFDATWFYLGDLYCLQSYPDPDLVSMTDVVPPAGNVSVILTNQCSQYTYGPPLGQNSTTMYTLTDTFGNVYALQSSVTDATSPQEWQDIVDSAVFPPGWTVGKETLTEKEMHYSYIIGDDCWLIILKDSAGSAWQQYIYGQPLEQSSFLSSFECPPLAKGEGVEANLPNGTVQIPSKPDQGTGDSGTSGSMGTFGSGLDLLLLLVVAIKAIF